jgi:hypothetical protein
LEADQRVQSNFTGFVFNFANATVRPDMQHGAGPSRSRGLGWHEEPQRWAQTTISAVGRN